MSSKPKLPSDTHPLDAAANYVRCAQKRCEITKAALDQIEGEFQRAQDQYREALIDSVKAIAALQTAALSPETTERVRVLVPVDLSPPKRKPRSTVQ